MIEDLRAVHEQLVAIHLQALITHEQLTSMTATVTSYQKEFASLSSAATAAQSTAAEALSGVGAQLAQTHADLYQLKGTTSEVAAHVADSTGQMSAAAVATGATLKGTIVSMSADLAQAHQSATQAFSALSSSADQTHHQLTTRLDDLQDAVADHTNLWNKAVSELIDAVKIGVTPIEDLLKLYGDAMIGGQRVREYLQGLDLGVYKQQMHDLIDTLQAGKTSIGSVLDYLGNTQLLFAKQLADTIKLFQDGKVTLQRVAEIVGQIQKTFPDSQFSTLAQTLEDALRKGNL